MVAALLAADPADSIRRRAENAEAVFDDRMALTLHRQLVRSFPSEFRYQPAFMSVMTRLHGQTKARQELKLLIGEGPLWQCYEAAIRLHLERLRALRTNPRARECVAYHLVTVSHEPEDIAILTQLFAANRLDDREASKLALGLAGIRNYAEAVRIVRVALERGPSLELRVHLTVELVRYLRALGRNAEAIAIGRRLEREVARSAAPAMMYWYASAHSHAMTPQKGDSLLRHAANVAMRHGAYGACAIALGKLVVSAIDRGDMTTATRWAPQAVACADKSTSDDERADTRVRYGRALVKSGKIKAAIPMLESAARFATRARHDYLIAEAEHNLAHAFESTGRWPEARQAADRFVAAAIRSYRSSQGIVSLRDAGIIYWDSGERAVAHKYFGRMVESIDRSGQESYWAGEYYERVGDLGRARSYYRRSLGEGGNEARKTAGLTRAYLAVGAVDSAQAMAIRHDALALTPEEVLLMPLVDAVRGRYADALRTSHQWALTQERRDNVRGAVNAYLQVAEIAGAALRFAESAAAARRAHVLAVAGNLEAEQARALVHLGIAQSFAGDTTAVSTLRQAVRHAQRSGVLVLIGEAWSALGDVLAMSQRAGAALIAFDSALTARSRIAEKFEEDLDRARYRDASADRLDHASWIAARSGGAELAFEWRVRRKAFSRPRQSLARVMRSLNAGEAVIDYLVSDSGVAALVMRRDTAAVIGLPVSRARIRVLVNRLRQPAVTSFGQLDRTRARFDHAAANELAATLITPLRPFLGSTDTWYVSPDDALHLVPFDTFLEDRHGQRSFLIESTTITYIPSPDARRGGGPISLQRVTLLASAAPGLVAETRAIQASVPNVTVTSEPTERTVARAAATATVLHFATHAEANSEQALSSFLRIAPGDDDDGFFHVNEIGQTDMRARLVVLSACETLVGRIFAQGPMSLAAAFIRAGARDVIATEWAVGPAAADFSRVLYQHLRNGAHARDAVRAAKLRMRRNPDTSNPLIWGAFVLMSG